MIKTITVSGVSCSHLYRSSIMYVTVVGLRWGQFCTAIMLGILATAHIHLLQAIHDRRSQLESMRIPPPHHIEIVDIYIHKGQTSDTSYSAPWKDCGKLIKCSLYTVLYCNGLLSIRFSYQLYLQVKVLVYIMVDLDS